MVLLVYSLILAFLLLVIVFRLQKSRVTVILLDKTCKYHDVLFATELLFCNNSKSNGNPIGFLSRGTRVMKTSRLAYKNTSYPRHSLLHNIAIVNPLVAN